MNICFTYNAKKLTVCLKQNIAKPPKFVIIKDGYFYNTTAANKTI